MSAYIEQLNGKRLRSYEADPCLLKERFGIEEAVLAGGYGYRQILELVQTHFRQFQRPCGAAGQADQSLAARNAETGRKCSA